MLCKDLQKALSLNCRFIKEGYGGSSSESIKTSRVKIEYGNHVSQKDLIEEDEFQEDLKSELAQLRKMINDNENKYQELENKQVKTKTRFKIYPEIERNLMRLHELEREKYNATNKKSRIEYNYRAKYLLLSTTTKRLKENYKSLKEEFKKKISEIDSFELERCRLISDISYLEQENRNLKSEIELIAQENLKIHSKRPAQIDKKVLKSNSTKTFCKSTIPKIRITSKDSILVSPLSNVSLPTVTHYSKRRESSEKDNSRILRGLPTSKGKPTPIKVNRSKNK